MKINTFTQLDSWREAHRLVLMIYKVTRVFPNDEVFGLVSQLRRAAVSISSNIAEGFSRETSADKKRFYFMAKGSVVEIQNQILIARDVGYLSSDNFMVLANQSIRVHKLINGLIRSKRDEE